MAKLECPKCQNSEGWRNVQMSPSGSSATCNECDTVVTTKGGFEVGTVHGNMVFGSPKRKS